MEAGPSRTSGLRPPYEQRRLSQGYPDLDRLALAKFIATLEAAPDDAPRMDRLLSYFNRLIDLQACRRILVLGCGPRPQAMRMLLERGYDVLGIDPIPGFARAASEYLGVPEGVMVGSAEDIPLPSGSQDIVFFESVLEHVDSPISSMREIFRVLNPGGLAFVGTTNRWRVSLSGNNQEFNVPFFNWFPAIVRESFIFFHLHYNPHLANYTERPAVHWFTYPELCALGRAAGFGQFYSPLDLLSRDDVPLSRSRGLLRRLPRQLLLDGLQASPWLRALALTQRGGEIIMLKRSS